MFSCGLYRPKEPGDTSVVGWQLMALKSVHMAYLKVPPSCVAGTSKFLDSVQTEYGAKYGYATPGAKHTTTAVGLLCRMYLGWKKDNEALAAGAKYLSDIGPKPTDMYYNYYATQVMRDRKSTRLNSSHVVISYAVFCLKKKNTTKN